MRAQALRVGGAAPARWGLRFALTSAAVVALAVSVGPAEAARSTTCGLTVLSSSGPVAAGEVEVVVPRSLSQLDLPATAFQADRGGRPVQVVVQPRSDGQPSVAVVIASSAKTIDDDFNRAREGALELLVGLPDGAQTSAFTTGQSAPLAALSGNRARTTRSLERAHPGTGLDSSGAVRRAAHGLPPGSHVVLFTDSAQDAAGALRAAGRDLQARGVVLERVSYRSGTADAQSNAAFPPGCTPTVAAVLPQVDALLSTIRGQYHLRVATTPSMPSTPTRLSVHYAGITSSTVLPVSSQPRATRVLADPYADTAFPATLTAGLYIVAAVMGLIGLLLAISRGPRGTAA